MRHSDPELITAAIAASGLVDRDGNPSAARFARLVAFGRSERTVRRWRSGESPIPPEARARLAWFLALPARRRAQLVALLATDETS